jgi:predicted ATPase/class 3 adenylate cyclase/DNA-binding CsgD family transcriptional regulator
MAESPTGTVTFLFTDIEGSTRLWERSPNAMRIALARHDEILRETIEIHRGHVFKTVGDAFCVAFSTAPEALEAALEVQRALFSEEWSEEIGSLRVRMALHTGAAEERDGDYFGPPLNRVARLLSAGYGGQILLSITTQELVRDQLPAGTQLRDLGERRLKDLFRPENIFQLIASDLPAEFPPLRTLDTRLNNLPIQPTPLVGREKEVGDICKRLRSSEVRLLTLTGPGGTGKTRVGLQVAAELLEEYEDGTFFVSLAAITDPMLVAATVAGTLGVREAGREPLIESLKEYLREKHMLLVLDNFEQVLEAAPMVTELLSAAPHLTIVATSRIPLRLYGEHEFAVPPLSLPEPKHPQPVERLTQYEAVRLFIERAKAVKADFSVTNENALAVAEICAHLDGLPLAIELAAARIKLLSPQAMLARLGNRLKFLTGGARDLPERRRTLRGTIEWSHELLDEGEKKLFARLAVFYGGCTLGAMEAVCDAEGDLPVDDVLEGASSLLDKSLLRQEEGPESEPRFSMLETIGEYAQERLEASGEAEEIRRLHAEYYLALAEEAEPRFRGPEEAATSLGRLETEHDNLRAALLWSLEWGEAELGLRLGTALLWFWSARGYWSEGARWLEEALAKGGAAEPATRAGALSGLGVVLGRQNDFRRAEACHEEALALYEELGDQARVAESLAHLGWMAEFRGDAARATTLFEKSLTAARESGNPRPIPSALNGLAYIAFESEALERAQRLWGKALALNREQGNALEVATVLNSMGYTELARGNQERATELLEESLPLNRELGNKHGVAHCLMALGIAATLRGEPERATALLKEGLVIDVELGSKADIAETLEGLAAATGALGEHVRAARLWGMAGALREAIDVPWWTAERLLHEPQLVAARSRMDQTSWETAFAEGRNMGLKEAVEYALSEEDSATLSTTAPEQSSAEESPPALTRREEEVAFLVARGLTNRQIASELSISEHTAATHVGKILKKLRLSSRSQLAD